MEPGLKDPSDSLKASSSGTGGTDTMLPSFLPCLGTVLALALMSGIGGALPQVDLASLGRRSIFEGLLYYLYVTSVLRAVSGRSHLRSPWIVMPLGVHCILQFLPGHGGGWGLWASPWIFAGISGLILLARQDWRKHLLGAVGMVAGGSSCWWYLKQSDAAHSENRWFVLVCLAAAAWLWVHDARRFRSAIKNLRWERVLHYLGMFVLGLYLSAMVQVSPWTLVAGGFSVVLAWGFAVANNDLYDLNIDRISNPGRPLVLRVWTPGDYGLLAGAQLLMALAGSLGVGDGFASALSVFIALAFVYSTPPLRLKQYIGVSASLIALASICLVLAGFLCSGERSFADFPGRMIVFLFIALTLGVNIKDLKDYAGDHQDGVQTLVTQFGLAWGKPVTALVFSLALISAPIILRRSDLMLGTTVFGVVGFLLILQARLRETYIFLVYYAYVIFLLLNGVFRI